MKSNTNSIKDRNVSETTNDEIESKMFNKKIEEPVKKTKKMNFREWSKNESQKKSSAAKYCTFEQLSENINKLKEENYKLKMNLIELHNRTREELRKKDMIIASLQLSEMHIGFYE